MPELNQHFYHVAPIQLEKGSIILPGNYGRIVTHTGYQHNQYGREMLLEYIRFKHYSDKPSRLHSCFVCDNLDDIKFFMQHHCSTGIIYEVSFLDDQAKQHIGCFNCLPPLPARFNKNAENVAHDYWKGEFIACEKAPKCKEIVSESAIKIINVVDLHDLHVQ